MNKWSDLPSSVQRDIAMNKFDLNDIGELAAKQIEILDSLSEDELFLSWCEWNGFIGYSGTIKKAVQSIYGKKGD